MGKQIAVLMGAINLDNQRQIVNGMIDAGKETDSNLYIFTNYVSSRENEENVRGAYHIMDLPDFSKFDAAILAINTINYAPAAERALEAIKKSSIPAVTIDHYIDGMSCVGISSYEAEYELVEHFITIHGADEIYYVRGPVGNKEADKRYQAYCDALANYNITYKEELVYTGWFTNESGRKAVRHFLKSGKCPRYIICANDNMAMGVYEVLTRKGYRIPEDTALAGFDNSELSQLNIPPITSVNKNQHEVGYKSVYEALELIEGKKTEYHIVPCKLEARGSCGCDKEKSIDVVMLKNRYVEHRSTTLRLADIVRDMVAEFSGLSRPESMIDILKKYVLQIELDRFYLCLCESNKIFMLPESNLGRNIDILQVNTEYTDKMELALAYENETFSEGGYFEKGMVLPQEKKDASWGNCYIVTPIFFQDCCYGYCISGNSTLPLEHSLYYSWVMNIGVALENIRKWMLLNDAVVRLNNMWSYDALTKLYNRAGFFYEAKSILDELCYEDKNVFLLFLDIDGLKNVNDTLGHEVGDGMIQEMSECIKENLGSNMLAMRYGGDEFVLFGSYEEPKERGAIVNAIQASVKARNEKGNNPFTLSVSIGEAGYKAREIKDLNQLIEDADRSMYEEKRRRYYEKNHIK
uniref:diguanylate cyclase domain-containing protein n=1 Tax=Agathobacter sp. TaxID=2021311 RepID=UPI00405600C3